MSGAHKVPHGAHTVPMSGAHMVRMSGAEGMLLGGQLSQLPIQAVRP